jgi:hypothetical protein
LAILTLEKRFKEAVCVGSVVTIEDVAAAILGHAPVVTHEVTSVVLGQLGSQVIQDDGACVGRIVIFRGLTKETGDQVVPLSLAGDPNAKHLGDDGEEVADKEDEEGCSDGDRGLPCFLIDLANLNLLATVHIF